MAAVMLEQFGFTRDQARIYNAIISNPAMDLGALCRDLEISQEHIENGLQHLASRGLITIRNDGFSVTDPEVAIGAMIRLSQERLERARFEAVRLNRKLREGRRSYEVQDIVESIPGIAAAEEHWRMAQMRARQRIRQTYRPPFSSREENAESIQAEIQRQQDGIQYSGLYDPEIQLRPAAGKARMVGRIQRGEIARTVTGIPSKMALIDDAEGLVVVGNYERPEDLITLRIFPSPLLDSLIALWDLLWSRGVPLNFATTEATETAIPHKDLLMLMASGLKDEAIASQMGLGIRTVRRRINELYDVLGVRTRFQAGAAAMERGWL